jgi:hypothetical protein
MKKLTVLALILTLALSVASFGGSANTSVEKGAKISFGGHNWIILDVQDGKALILSENIIEERPFHPTEDIAIGWGDCELRQYLNGEFYEKVFTAEEKKRIIETEITNSGINTKDKVFLLSSREVSMSKYFKATSERIALYMNTREASWWWLRLLGKSISAEIVGQDGLVYVRVSGGNVSKPGGVRPALWLNL